MVKFVLKNLRSSILATSTTSHRSHHFNFKNIEEIQYVIAIHAFPVAQKRGLLKNKEKLPLIFIHSSRQVSLCLKEKIKEAKVG